MLPRELSPQMVLASQSPRRTELLALTGLPFTQQSAQIDESHRAGETPTQHARRLAHEKAASAVQLNNDDCLVIAADTIVVQNDAILGKPANTENADRMLRDLQGGIHTVITAIAVTTTRSGIWHEECCSTQVRIRRLSRRDRQGYISSGDPMDKAGAYGIQNRQFRPATTIGGCFANVVGLPLCHVVRAFSDSGVTPTVDIANACAAHTGYDCPVHQNILCTANSSEP
jgi:MAF protein